MSWEPSLRTNICFFYWCKSVVVGGVVNVVNGGVSVGVSRVVMVLKVVVL